MKTLEDSWQAYYQFTEHAPPRETLLKALDYFDAENGPGEALDLGCGNGRDSVELLRRNWKVRAIDQEQEAEAFIRKLLLPEWNRDFHFEAIAFHQLYWQPVDLVNASYALPFCTRQYFDSVWQNLSTTLRPGGRFAGQLFGERDGWAGKRAVICHSREAIEGLLKGFQIEYWEEEEVDETGLDGLPKHWHIHHLVVCKPTI